jgi:hypothetical protein
MSNISQLLNDADATYRLQLNETKQYVTKWDKTGLLEGIDTDYEKHNTAILLENQARQLISEATSNTGNGGEDWNGVALPLVRRIFGEIFAKEFVSVQPMNLPSGLVFWLDFKYGSDHGNHVNGTDIMGNTSASSTPAGGLYNAAGHSGSEYGAKAAFTLAKKELAITHTAGASDNAIMNFSASDMTGIDGDLAGAAYVVSRSAADGSADVIVTDNTAVSADGADLYFTLSQTIPAAQPLVVVYYEDRNAQGSANRGDFEDQTSDPVTSLKIPELNVQLRNEAIVAKTRKLKVVWSPEFAQDLNAYHSIDAEAELTSMLSEYVSMEIDLEILAMLDNAALHTGETFVLSGSEKGYVGTQATTGTTARYDFGSWAQTLGYQMQKVSNQIHKGTMRGGANFAVMSPEIASIVESIPGFAADTDGTKSQFAAGVTKVGSFANRYTIYKNPYRTTNDGILMGFRGNQFLETGAVYAPYIPLIMTPLVYDPQNFTPRKGVMTRYAKKVVRPEFYGKVNVTIH